MMGAGKSTVGALLADRLGGTFVDLDGRVVDKVGLSIPDIFAQHGEAGFRDYEEECLRECLSHVSGGVLALGGGTLDRQANRALLRDRYIIWLDADPTLLFARADSVGRPLTRAGMSAFLERYRNREALFREVAALRIDVTGTTPEDVVNQIVARGSQS